MMRTRLPRTTPEIHDVAVQIAVTSRIVVQGLLPPGLWPEIERRVYLTVCGVLEQPGRDRADPVVHTPS